MPLGVQLLNENKIDEMAKIMESLQKYVPMKKATGTMLLPNRNVLEFDDTKAFGILFGGDQLTVARAHGAAALRCNHETVCDRLEGLEPVIEDWHARLTYVINFSYYIPVMPIPYIGYLGKTVQQQISEREGHLVSAEKFN